VVVASAWVPLFPGAAAGGDMTGTDRGLYFLANDPYVEWTTAFLESVRAWNPDLGIVMIPFDDRIDKLDRLRARYGFSIVDDPSLTALDELGRAALDGLHGSLPAQTFRKLWCFWGCYEQFVFLDTDIIVMMDLGDLVDGLKRGSAQLTFAHSVTADGIYSSTSLRDEARTHGYDPGVNTGAWASRRGLFSLSSFEELAAEFLPRRVGVIPAGEQGFLNWCLLQHRAPIESFGVSIGRHGWLWAGDIFPMRQSRDHGRPYLEAPDAAVVPSLVHWAGFALSPTMPYRRLWRAYRWPTRALRDRAARTHDTMRRTWLRAMAHRPAPGHYVERRSKGRRSAPEIIQSTRNIRPALGRQSQPPGGV
jgi:hypothetical protein